MKHVSHASLIPSRPSNHRHATKQNVELHFRQAQHHSYPDMGLRTETHPDAHNSIVQSFNSQNAFCFYRYCFFAGA
ncbi:hypothetical protein TNCV_262101 [Trichonephila clavipes]|nr:hypothetical protein TNCV_262101 [Trichonephila clavipes]